MAKRTRAGEFAVNIKLNTKATKMVEDRLRELLVKVSDTTDLNKEIAKYMLSDTRRRFYYRKSPDGQPWAPLSPVTIELRARIAAVQPHHTEMMKALFKAFPMTGFTGTAEPLVDTGALKRSIHVEDLGNRGFIIVADVAYAAAQQKGVESTTGMIPGTSVPARPFLGWSAANKKWLSKKIASYLSKKGIE